MKARGYSLVEMVVVIGIISILLSIATLRFNEYSKRYRMEAQTRLIYNELLQARINALYQRRTTRVKLYPNRFEIYSSTHDDTAGVAPVRTHPLSFPIICTGDEVAAKGYPVVFDSAGIAVESRTLCLDEGDALAAVDSVVISKTRVRIGKKDNPDECDPNKISTR
jgi:prepilin-type N-terminal cleavage/methylation domain-containing protein